MKERECRPEAVLLAPFAVVYLAVLLRILAHPQYIDNIAALYCHCAQFILQGKQPYVDFVDLMPPCVFYWFVPPVYLAPIIHLTVPLTVALMTFCLAIYSLVGSLLVLRRRTEPADKLVLAALLFGLALFNLPVFHRFTEREYFFVLAFMPFFLMRWLRQNNKKFNVCFAAAIGALVGAITCFKPPQFAFLVLALEVYWWAKSKRPVERLKDAEIIAWLTAIPVCVFAFWVFSSEATRNEFLHRWMPITISGYWAYSHGIYELFSFADPRGTMIPGWPSLIVVCACAFIFRNRHSLIAPLLVWTAAGFCVYLIQQTGWSYQTIPMVSGYFLLANLELALTAKWLAGSPEKLLARFQQLRFPPGWAELYLPLVFSAYTALLALSLPLIIKDSLTTGITSPDLEEVLLKYTKKGDPVLILSTSVPPAYPLLVQMDRKPASRYLITNALKMYEFLKYRSRCNFERTHYEREESRIAAEIREDVEANRPVLIAASVEPLRWNKQWNVFRYLEQHGLNRALNGYRSIGLWNNCLVWVRAEPK